MITGLLRNFLRNQRMFNKKWSTATTKKLFTEFPELPSRSSIDYPLHPSQPLIIRRRVRVLAMLSTRRCDDDEDALHERFATRVGSWYYRQLRDGTLTLSLMPMLLRLVPSTRHKDLMMAYIRFQSLFQPNADVERAVLESVSPELRSEILIATAMKTPTLDRLRSLPQLPPAQALAILQDISSLELPEDVLINVAKSALSGTQAECATAINKCLEASTSVIPHLALALKAQGLHVDGAALVSALQGMGTSIAGLEDLYIKGCVLLGQHETAFRFCGSSSELQRLFLESLLDNCDTREACEYLSAFQKPEEVMNSQVAARLVRQLASTRADAKDTFFYQHAIQSIVKLLMVIQDKREIDIAVAAALGACGEWQLALTFFSKCETLSDMELLLISAAKGGAPFNEVKPFVVAVSETNPSLSNNGLRELMIRCASEAGAVEEALTLFKLAASEGSANSLLDHHHFVGMPGCEDVPFSISSLLSAGAWQDAKAKCVTQSDIMQWENYIVANEIESELQHLSVGSAVRLLIRLCKESRWRLVLEEYFPSVPIAHTTRQWVSHFIAARLCSVANADVAYAFLCSHSKLSAEEALMLLHVVAPSARTVALLTDTHWRSGLLCLKHLAPGIIPPVGAVGAVAAGWLVDHPGMKALARVVIRKRTLRRVKRDGSILHFSLSASSATIGHEIEAVELVIPPSPLTDMCRHYGALPAEEVVSRWARLLTQYHITSDAVAVWLMSCSTHRNVAAALEVIRLSIIVNITPPLGPLLAVADLLDYTTPQGQAALALFQRLPSAQSLMSIIGKKLLASDRSSDPVPLVSALCGRTDIRMPMHWTSSIPIDLSDLGPSSSVPAIPLPLFSRLCQSEKICSCDIVILGEGSVHWLSSGAAKGSYLEGVAACKKVINVMFAEADVGMWRAALECIQFLSTHDSLTWREAFRALALLSVSPITPTELLAVIPLVSVPTSGEGEFLSVLLSCYFAHHGMEQEAQKHLSTFASSTSNMMRLAHIMVMLPSPSLKALAWVRLDTVAMECIFGKPHKLSSATRRLIESSPFAHSVAYRWLLRPAHSLLDVGASAGHAVEAADVVKRFEIPVKNRTHRVRVKLPCVQ